MKYPNTKAMEKNLGYSGAKKGVKVKEIKGPANKGVLATNPTKKGGIMQPTRGKKK
jgi:hypothetical protein